MNCRQVREWLDGLSNDDNIYMSNPNGNEFEIVGVRVKEDHLVFITDYIEKVNPEEETESQELARLRREQRAIARAIEEKRPKRAYHYKTDAERAALGLPPRKKNGRPKGMTKGMSQNKKRAATIAKNKENQIK